jgi:hypothetical protein
MGSKFLNIPTPASLLLAGRHSPTQIPNHQIPAPTTLRRTGWTTLGVQDDTAPAERLGWPSPDDSPAAAVTAHPLRWRICPSVLPSRIPSRGEAAAAGGDGTAAFATAAPPSDWPPSARIRPHRVIGRSRPPPRVPK